MSLKLRIDEATGFIIVDGLTAENIPGVLSEESLAPITENLNSLTQDLTDLNTEVDINTNSINELKLIIPTLVKSNVVVNRVSNSINEEVLWSVNVDKSKYTNKSNFLIYALFSFSFNGNGKEVIFRMNGVNVLKLTNSNQASGIYTRNVHNISFTNQVSYPTERSETGNVSSAGTGSYNIDTTNGILFEILTKVNVATDTTSLLAAYIRIDP